MSTPEREQEAEVSVKRKGRPYAIAEVEAEMHRQRRVDNRRRRLLNGSLILCLLVAVISLMVLTITPVIEVSGESMEAAFEDGDMLLFQNLSRKYEQGDIIVFEHDGQMLVKRIIASAGDVVSIDETGRVSVNGSELTEDYVEEASLGTCDITFPYTVPEDGYFVMGDHRSVSLDSRTQLIGCVSSQDIAGKYLFRIWPLFGR